MEKRKEPHSFCNILVPNKEKTRECCGNSILFTKVSQIQRLSIPGYWPILPLFVACLRLVIKYCFCSP